MPGEKIKSTEISIGKALPWAVCDANGILLLQKGSIISNQKQLDALLQRGLYIHEEKSHAREDIEMFSGISSSPFNLFQEFMDKVSNLFSAIILKQEDTEKRLSRLCRELYEFCLKYPDASLGCVHLCQNTSYTICHPLHVAILCQMIAYRQGYHEEKILSIIAAALTCNVSILELQEILHHQNTPLIQDQKDSIAQHPIASANMLRDAGISDPLCLNIIEQHHERPDGDGYPNAIQKDALSRESQILRIADRYSAMTSCRGYRKAIDAKTALREFFLKKETEFDETMILAFIKELSVFPPGTFVRLKNGEVAVVIKRGNKSMWPIVASIMGPANNPYALPLRRDCNDKDYSIDDIHYLEKVPPLNLSRIWGYL